jgi:hypothetical protein
VAPSQGAFAPLRGRERIALVAKPSVPASSRPPDRGAERLGATVAAPSARGPAHGPVGGAAPAATGEACPRRPPDRPRPGAAARTAVAPSSPQHHPAPDRRRRQDRHIFLWHGNHPSATLFQPHRYQRRLDLDPPITPAHLNGSATLQPSRFANLLRDHVPSGSVDGSLHAAYHSVNGAVFTSRRGDRLRTRRRVMLSLDAGQSRQA